MNILVVSDTHGYAERIKDVLAAVGEVDLFIHAGDVEGQADYIRSLFDCPIYMVAGNNDWGTSLSSELTFRLGDYRVFLTHGNRYGVSLGPERLLDEAVSRRADIAIFGHTHRPMLEKKNNVMLMNPGSLTYPRQGGRRPTYGLIRIDQEHEAKFSIEQL